MPPTHVSSSRVASRVLRKNGSRALLRALELLLGLTPAGRSWRLLRVLLRVLDDLLVPASSVAHWPALHGGGWQVVKVCQQIGQYPPNNHWYVASTVSNPWASQHHGWVSICLAGQSNAGQPKTLLPAHNLAVESHKYPVSFGFRHRLVRSWARPTAALPYVVNLPAARPVIRVWPDPAAVPELVVFRGVAAKLAPLPTSFTPVPREVPLAVRRAVAWPFEVEVPSARPAPISAPRPTPVVGPEPVDEVTIEPGQRPRVRRALAYAEAPPRRVRERKARLSKRGLEAMFWLARQGVNAFTEGLDVLDALHDALPVNVRIKRHDPWARAQAVWRWWRYIDVGRAVEGLVMNAVEDAVWGIASGTPAAHARVRPQVAIGYTAGPAL